MSLLASALWVLTFTAFTRHEVHGVSGCFHGEELAETEDDGPKMVKNLRQGDRVLAVNANGTIVYSTVFIQFHADNDEEAKAIVLHLHESGKQLVLTPDHLLFVSKRCATPSFSKAGAYYASDVQVGDCLFIVHRESIDEVEPTSLSVRLDRVSAVKTKAIRGVYAPVTHEGTIIVSDVVASCYAVLADHYHAHNIFAVFHYLPAEAMEDVQNMFKKLSMFQLSKWLWSISDKITSVENGVCFKRLH